MKISTLLKKARRLLTNPKRWLKGAEAADRRGVLVSPRSKKAETFCAIGAVGRYTSEGWDSATQICLASNALAGAIRSKTFRRDIVGFNDAKRTSHKQLLGVFDRAIKAELKKEASK